jgi:hypothetical protein
MILIIGGSRDGERIDEDPGEIDGYFRHNLIIDKQSFGRFEFPIYSPPEFTTADIFLSLLKGYKA